MSGRLQWVPGEMGHQPDWPQGGFGEGRRGCLALQGLMGFTLFSGDFEPVFPSGVRFLLASGLGVLGEVPVTSHLYGCSPIPSAR